MLLGNISASENPADVSRISEIFQSVIILMRCISPLSKQVRFPSGAQLISSASSVQCVGGHREESESTFLLCSTTGRDGLLLTEVNIRVYLEGGSLAPCPRVIRLSDYRNGSRPVINTPLHYFCGSAVAKSTGLCTPKHMIYSSNT